MTKQQFAELLSALHVNQSQLARALGLERRTIGRWLGGKSTLPGRGGQLLLMALIGMLETKLHVDRACTAADGCLPCWVALQTGCDVTLAPSGAQRRRAKRRSV